MTLANPERGICVIPGKLFLHCMHEKPPDSITDHYFLLDLNQKTKFSPISRENGPPTLPLIYNFINMLKDKITKINKQIHICCSLGSMSRVNCILMLSVFISIERDFIEQILQQQMNSKYAKPRAKAKPNYENPLPIFAGVYPRIEDYEDVIGSPFKINIKDVFDGFIRAYRNGWYSQSKFDEEVYEFYSATENGSMTWIVPNRLLVLAGPSIGDAPALFDMLPLLRKWKIKHVVNFTSESRGSEDLARVNIERTTFDCPQDGLPSIDDVLEFIRICNKGEPVAIYSYNGLGRAPTFAAAWLVHTFGFAPKEAIGWIRCVRQGAIYSIQQDFILRMGRYFNNK